VKQNTFAFGVLRPSSLGGRLLQNTPAVHQPLFPLGLKCGNCKFRTVKKDPEPEKSVKFFPSVGNHVPQTFIFSGIVAGISNKRSRPKMSCFRKGQAA